MSGHTKEPWKFLGPQGVLSCEVVCADGVTIAEVEYEPDAHRIIACVNSCEGVTQEMFDGGFICREAMAQVRAAIAGADRSAVEVTESEGGDL